MTDESFDLERFLPYVLNQAAEAASRGFQAIYRSDHGFTRTQWRVMAHLGKSGPMTARDICRLSHMDKTKVSRAVAGLEEQGHLTRARSLADGRAESLSLTERGQTTYAALGQRALAYDSALKSELGEDVVLQLNQLLRILQARAKDLPES